MANIKNHITNQVNIVAIPEKSVDINSINTNAIKAKIISVIKDSQPVITQFPDLLLILDTNNQFAVNIIKQNNRIIIADNRVTNYSGRDLTKFYQLVREVVDIVVPTPNKVTSYGLNIVSTFDIEGDSVDSGNEIKKRFLNETVLSGIFNNIKSAGIKIVHEENEVRYELAVEPRFGPNLEVTNQVSVNLNAHHIQSLPDLPTLQTNGNLIYSSLGQNVVKIFS